MSRINGLPGVLESSGNDWREQLKFVVAAMRELSEQTDPQEMGKVYGRRMRQLMPVDASLSVSRRDLDSPWYRITRSSRWTEEINPWKQKERLPLLRGGLLSQLLYSNEPHLFDDLHVPHDDPAREYLSGYSSVVAIPMYDRGEALNMVLLMRSEPGAFRPEQFPQMVWTSNLYGRATHNLVLSGQLSDAYKAADYEMQTVGNIQRSLLPASTPTIPTVGVAAHYQTSQRAGGDYYDFFPLHDGRWGFLIADVSGHGTPAAVVMAVTHALAHTYSGTHEEPAQLLGHLNTQLHRLHTSRSDTFVTAFYAIYDPKSRLMTYSSAGHNPPRLKRCQDGTLALFDQAGGLPLGILPNEEYQTASHQLVPGDQLVLYTDGITEAHNDQGEMFGLTRLDKVLENCSIAASDLLQSVLEALETFTGKLSAHDDRTLLVLKIT